MADRGECRFDYVGRSKVRPVRGGEVVEREGFVAVASQAGGGFWGTCRRSARFSRRRHVRPVPSFRPSRSRADPTWPSRGRTSGVVQDVPGLVHPTALRAGLRVHFRQRRPEPQRPVAHGQLRRAREAALLHRQQLGAAHTVARSARDASEWTRPADRAASYRTCGQAMEKLTLPQCLRPDDSWERQQHRLRPVPGLLGHPRKSVYGILGPGTVGIPRGNPKNNTCHGDVSRTIAAFTASRRDDAMAPGRKRYLITLEAKWHLV